MGFRPLVKPLSRDGTLSWGEAPRARIGDLLFWMQLPEAEEGLLGRSPFDPEPTLTATGAFVMFADFPSPHIPVPGLSSALPEFPSVPDPTVSIVIPAWNQWEFTLRCLNAILQNTPEVAYEIIVVDNGSTDATAQDLPRIKGIEVIRNSTNRGFAIASNQGAWAARGRYILFLNNDTEPLPGWLPPLVQILDEESGIGVVGAKLLYPDGSLQHAGVLVGYGNPFPIAPFHVHRGEAPEVADRRLDLLVVTGACMLIRASLCREIGGFDEGYLNGYEDVDLCFKVQDAGFGVVFTPKSQLVHHESLTPGRNDHMDHNCDLLHRRWMARYWELTRDVRPAQKFEASPPGRVPLSVIVLSQDSLRTIVACLESLSTQLSGLDQLLLSDGGSQDCTPLYLSLFASDLPGMASVVHGSDGLDRAAKSALWAARHPNAVILPAAFIPPPGFMDRIGSHLFNTHRGAQVSDVGGGMRFFIGPVKELLALSSLQVTDC